MTTLKEDSSQAHIKGDDYLEPVNRQESLENHDGQKSSDEKHGVLHNTHVWLSIFILFLNYFLAQYDKFILSYFQAEVLSSLAVTPAQYGLLSGYSTGIVYALLALPVAFIADYTSARVWTLTIAALWWSLMVIFQSLAHNFGQIYCARLGMGIGQAAVEALSVSLITDMVQWRNAFLGNSALYVGVYIGEAVSGQIATAFRVSDTGWQVALRAIGITGLVIAVILRVVLREPDRRKSLVNDDDSADFVLSRRKSAWRDFKATVAYLVRMRSFALLVFSAAMRQLGGNVFGYYMPGYLSSVYPDRINLLSRYGIIVGTVGSFSVLFGGALTSLLWHRTKLTPIYLTAIGGMISSIFVLLMIFSSEIANDSEDKGISILYGVMAIAYLTAETWLGCLYALIALLFPPTYKTFAFAIWGSVQALIYSSGPEIIGLALRNTEAGSEEYIRVTKICLAVIIPFGYWVCGIGLLCAIPLLRRDFRQQFVQGTPSLRRRMSLWSFVVLLACLVIVLFTVSLVYEA